MERAEQEDIIESDAEKEKRIEKESRLSKERIDAWKELFSGKALYVIANEINSFYRKNKKGKFLVEIGYEGEIEKTIIVEKLREHELSMEKWNILFKNDEPDRIAYFINSYYIQEWQISNKRCLFVVDMQET